MNFKLWIEDEASLNGITPEIRPQPEIDTDNNDTPASNGVIRSGLQPQVDGQKSEPKSMVDQDKVGAIDADLERLRATYANSGVNNGSRINKFRQMLDSLINQWNSVKMSDSRPENSEDVTGLGQTMGDQQYLKMMQQHKNATPVTPEVPNGPGTFGDIGNN